MASLYRRIAQLHQAPWWKTWSEWRGVIFAGRGGPAILVEANFSLDVGSTYLQRHIVLVEELRALQDQATLDLCLAWFDRYR